MNADVFIDTNVLLYTIDEDPASASKRQQAEQLLLSQRWGWSVQVAAEFFVNATLAKRPFKLAAADAVALVETWFSFPTADLTPALVFSEDLNDGQNYDGVTVVNPFKMQRHEACPGRPGRRFAPARPANHIGSKKGHLAAGYGETRPPLARSISAEASRPYMPTQSRGHGTRRST
jgi:predicted nucleic acid-binding protein